MSDSPASHVFVTRGNLLNLACDAWMLPTDKTLTVAAHWRGDAGLGQGAVRVENEVRFAAEDCLAASIIDVDEKPWPDEKPLVVATAVPFRGVDPGRTGAANKDALNHIGRAVREFVEVATVAVQKRRNRASQGSSGTGDEPGRDRILLGMPSFATDAGGGGHVRGEVLKAIMEAARGAAASSGVDMAIVLRDAGTYAQAQHLRRAVLDSASIGLTLDQIDMAKEFSSLAREGRLVPFVGAGISVSAGAPSWVQLLEDLGRAAGLTQERIEALQKRNPLDQASILRMQFDVQGKDFGQEIAGAVSVQRYGMAPILLANLHTAQAVTLNYDELFEKASEDCGSPRRVIPGNQRANETNSWLLKLHGTVSDPKSIVLTRDDYLGFSATRNALSAIVKANLITNHLLFVGFGLADDHFHEIVHDVRRALPADTDVRATALVLKVDDFDRALWDKDLRFIEMGDETTDIPTAARNLEIFLDAVAVYASTSQEYLLDPDFKSSLSATDEHLKEALLELGSNRSEFIASAAWPKVESLLRSLGWDEWPVPDVAREG